MLYFLGEEQQTANILPEIRYFLKSRGCLLSPSIHNPALSSVLCYKPEWEQQHAEGSQTDDIEPSATILLIMTVIDSVNCSPVYLHSEY